MAVKLAWMMGKWASDRGGDRRYSEATQQPASPPQANVDVSHLLSILTAGLRMGTPRINTFSSDATPGKTKVSFKQWYHEVQYASRIHYPEAVLWESIIQLLKGAAVAYVARYMGLTTSVAHTLCKIWVIFESIIQLLKRPVADMARYIGPTTSVAHVLCKILVIFGMMTSFDVLMQNFYKASQGSNEKVPSFAT